MKEEIALEISNVTKLDEDVDDLDSEEDNFTSKQKRTWPKDNPIYKIY